MYIGAYIYVMLEFWVQIHLNERFRAIEHIVICNEYGKKQ